MYQYTAVDQSLVDARVEQFRDQTERFLAGELSEDQFRPLRLQNGLYVQRLAPMLRVAIPYGLLSSKQLRTQAQIARQYDKGYAHFTTRQNIQFNWPELAKVPDILADLAKVQMHAIQTSGNCIRNITMDHFAGIARDEIVDPIAWAELLRQWSTLHPEFAFMPRKFKIAINGATQDRAAIQLHDIGLQALRAQDGAIGFKVYVGGGMGRTPIVGQAIEEFIAAADTLNYLEAILRVYNLFGRRDNKYKARIKILVKELGLPAFRHKVQDEFELLLEQGKQGSYLKNDSKSVDLSFETSRFFAQHNVLKSLADIQSRIDQPTFKHLPDQELNTLQPPASALPVKQSDVKRFQSWLQRNTRLHKFPGYAAVSVSLKRPGVPPGDVTAAEMDSIASLADRYSFGLLRVTHEQNLLLPHVEQAQLPTLYQELIDLGLANANIGLISNIIACPGGDFCALANAVSLPLAEALLQQYEDLDYQYDIGELDLNISGCINSCGHHHVGHIGILGVDKANEAYYQVSLGGHQGSPALVGKIIGPSFKLEEVPRVIDTLIQTYLRLRDAEHERFVDVVQRLGIGPFKEAVYAQAN